MRVCHNAVVLWCAVGDGADGSSSHDLVAVWSSGTERTDGLRTALVVDRRVRHIETQLYVNRRRRAFFARIFGLDDDNDAEELGTTHGRGARSSRLHPGNDYFDERCRLRMLQARGAADNSPPGASSLSSSALPLLATSVAPSTPVVKPQQDDRESEASSLQGEDMATTSLPHHSVESA